MKFSTNFYKKVSFFLLIFVFMGQSFVYSLDPKYKAMADFLEKFNPNTDKKRLAEVIQRNPNPYVEVIDELANHAKRITKTDFVVKGTKYPPKGYKNLNYSLRDSIKIASESLSLIQPMPVNLAQGSLNLSDALTASRSRLPLDLFDEGWVDHALASVRSKELVEKFKKYALAKAKFKKEVDRFAGIAEALPQQGMVRPIDVILPQNYQQNLKDEIDWNEGQLRQDELNLNRDRQRGRNVENVRREIVENLNNQIGPINQAADNLNQANNNFQNLIDRDENIKKLPEDKRKKKKKKIQEEAESLLNRIGSDFEEEERNLEQIRKKSIKQKRRVKARSSHEVEIEKLENEIKKIDSQIKKRVQDAREQVNDFEGQLEQLEQERNQLSEGEQKKRNKEFTNRETELKRKRILEKNKANAEIEKLKEQKDEVKKKIDLKLEEEQRRPLEQKQRQEQEQEQEMEIRPEQEQEQEQEQEMEIIPEREEEQEQERKLLSEEGQIKKEIFDVVGEIPKDLIESETLKTLKSKITNLRRAKASLEKIKSNPKYSKKGKKYTKTVASIARYEKDIEVLKRRFEEEKQKLQDLKKR